MKRLLFYMVLLTSSVAHPAQVGRLQDADFKTLTQLTNAGATASSLLNTTKIYDATYAGQLSALVSKSGLAGIASAASGTVLTSNGSGQGSWVAALTNPMTTVGDLIVGGSSGSPTRFAAGAAGAVLTSTGTAATPVWAVEATARYSCNQQQQFSSGATTVINFNTSVYDTATSVTTGASWRFTATAATAGRYAVKAQIVLASGTYAAAQQPYVMIYKNGAQYSNGPLYFVTANGSYVMPLNVNDEVQLANTDYIDIRFLNASSNTQALSGSAVQNYVTVTRVGL